MPGPAASTNSTASRSRPSSFSDRSQASGSESDPSASRPRNRRSGTTSDVRTAPFVDSGINGRKVRARPSASRSRGTSSLCAIACTPNQYTPGSPVISAVIRLRGTVIEKVVDAPGSRTSTLAETSVIRSPTKSAASSSAASASSARDVIGALETNG